MIAILFLLTTTSIFDSYENDLFHITRTYMRARDMTYFEMFNKFDCNHDKYIDSTEMNTLLKDVGIPWSMRWPDKVIEYFEQDEVKDSMISWDEFKVVLRNFQSNY